jgi:hypothetical protein
MAYNVLRWMGSSMYVGAAVFLASDSEVGTSRRGRPAFFTPSPRRSRDMGAAKHRGADRSASSRLHVDNAL